MFCLCYNYFVSWQVYSFSTVLQSRVYKNLPNLVRLSILASASAIVRLTLSLSLICQKTYLDINFESIIQSRFDYNEKKIITSHFSGIFSPLKSKLCNFRIRLIFIFMQISMLSKNNKTLVCIFSNKNGEKFTLTKIFYNVRARLQENWGETRHNLATVHTNSSKKTFF